MRVRHAELADVVLESGTRTRPANASNSNPSHSKATVCSDRRQPRRIKAATMSPAALTQAPASEASHARAQALQRLQHLASGEMAFIATPLSLRPLHSLRTHRRSSPLRAPPVAPHAIAEPHIQPGVDFHGIPNPAPGTPLRLDDLRERLIRQEETIIFALIERAQFRLNPCIYAPGLFDLPDPAHAADPAATATATGDGSFSQYLLYELEKVYARVRRYTSPDEQPFAPPHILPNPILDALEYPQTLKKNDINLNHTIENVYRNSILQSICQEGDDQNYGSAATCDVACLQALSKRIHYGKFIAESKCQENESEYRHFAQHQDRDAIWNSLSNLSVEKMLLKRVENKATSYGSDITVHGSTDVFKVDPVTISDIYRDFIIPLTKEVEVDYILHRYATQ